MLRIAPGEKLLFIGDSITDCDYRRVAPPLGGGFVLFVSCLLAARYPECRVEVINRGNAGDTILDLERRWDDDALAIRPDWLFVMIGVNDVLYRHVSGGGDRAVSDEEYRSAYRRILGRTRETSSSKIVLLEPTPLEEYLPAESHAYMRAICGIVREVAAEVEAEVCPTFEAFHAAVSRAPDRGWMVDVPHPNLNGHAVLALTILRHLGWESGTA